MKRHPLWFLCALSFAFFTVNPEFSTVASAAEKEKAPSTENKKKEKPKKVSELLQKVTDLMDAAQDAYVDGDAQKAIAGYRDALKEIDRIEAENFDRADTPEFAPVRFRRALCETTIDRIMLEEASATSRTVAVTDTTELEKRRAERKKAAETNNVPDTAIHLSAKKSAEELAFSKHSQEKKEKADGKNEKLDINGELEFAKDMQSVQRFEDAEHSLVKILKVDPDNREAMFLLALVQLQSGRAKDSLILLDDLLTDTPRDEATLLLAAAAHTSAGEYSKAMEKLDLAMKINPKRPDGYHNMAWLLVEMNPKQTKEAEAYYRQAIRLGGARDLDLERRLGLLAE
ncbi:MAG: tetratricopeptide repeat protein [Kiritimatiellae bacterium]|nr:tetratricopeptide repeat protein [Kiritimatiellia bacterium]